MENDKETYIGMPTDKNWELATRNNVENLFSLKYN